MYFQYLRFSVRTRNGYLMRTYVKTKPLEKCTEMHICLGIKDVKRLPFHWEEEQTQLTPLAFLHLLLSFSLRPASTHIIF